MDPSSPAGPLEALRIPLLGTPRERVVEAFLARAGHRTPIFCPACGATARPARFDAANLRETGACSNCGATNRQRQIALAVVWALNRLSDGSGRSLRSAASSTAPTVAVYNTESNGPVHQALSTLPGYVASEFIGPDHEGGSVHDGVRHEDLQSLSFDDSALDLVVSSDVLEHVPSPYVAHAEIHRVLRVGGRHVFTVPFHGRGFHDEVRSVLGPDGAVQHLAPPMYHQDPIRPDDGVLVYNIFSLEMLLRLREIGFVTYVYKMHSPIRGIVGENALVFEAVKADWAWR